MSDTDLLVGRAPVPTPGPVHFVIGQEIGEIVEASLSGSLPGISGSVHAGRPNDATLSGRLPGISGIVLAAYAPQLLYPAVISGNLSALSGSVRAGRPNDATISGSLPALSGSATASYALNVARPTVNQVRVAHQVARRVSAAVTTSTQSAKRLQLQVEVAHQPGQPYRASTSVRHADGLRMRSSAAASHAEAIGVRAQVAIHHTDMLRTVRPSVRIGHQEGVRLASAVTARHADMLRLARPSVRLVHQDAVRLAISRRQRSGVGVAIAITKRLVHQDAMRPPIGRWVPPKPPLPEPCYAPNPHLVVGRPAAVDGHLLIVCQRDEPSLPPATLVIPIREVYMLFNNLNLVRVSDGQPVPVNSASLGLDLESWTWGFQARLPGKALPLVDAGDGDPVELLLTVNGNTVKVRVESIQRDRRFGSSELSVRGRGSNAVLDEPYAARRTFEADTDLTAQQLAADALTLNGVPLGWAVDWQLEDWLVPAGAWLHQGAPMSAIKAIAAAAGGYVQPHATDNTLRILHRYPALPRDWPGLEPDLELPADLVTVEGIEWLNKPAYNRVFVAGGDIGGRLGQVTLTGTAGDLPAQGVVDPLLTHIAAGRQRGRAILGDTGRQARVSLRVPSLPELGLVVPGKLLRYVDGSISRLGLVRSFQLDAQHGYSSQSIGVETHV